MVEHPDRVHEVHGAGTHGRTREIPLHDVDGVEPLRVARRRLHGLAEVDADDVARAELGGQPQVPALAAAAVQHAPALERLRSHRRDPAEKLVAVLRPDLGEPRPLVAEALRHDHRVAVHHPRHEAGNPAHDRVARIAPGTPHGAVSNLSRLSRSVAQRQAAAAGRAREPFEQALAHQTTRCRRAHNSSTSSV